MGEAEDEQESGGPWPPEFFLMYLPLPDMWKIAEERTILAYFNQHITIPVFTINLLQNKIKYMYA